MVLFAAGYEHGSSGSAPSLAKLFNCDPLHHSWLFVTPVPVYRF
jgi:hypothetical protein